MRQRIPQKQILSVTKLLVHFRQPLNMRTNKIRSSWRNVLNYSMQDSCVNPKSLWIKEGLERCLNSLFQPTFVLKIVVFLLQKKNFIILCESELEEIVSQNLLKGKETQAHTQHSRWTKTITDNLEFQCIINIRTGQRTAFLCSHFLCKLQSLLSYLFHK